MLRPWELEQYTLSEFLNAHHGQKVMQAEQWAQARLVAYYAVVPHQKKNSRLKLRDILEIPLFDNTAVGGKSGKTPKVIGRVYRLTPEEIEQWHAGTWKPNEELH